jgi:3-phenylpropionate/trans-cinnamate dioxygenase ferredoxin reductase subunit
MQGFTPLEPPQDLPHALVPKIRPRIARAFTPMAHPRFYFRVGLFDKNESHWAWHRPPHSQTTRIQAHKVGRKHHQRARRSQGIQIHLGRTVAALDATAQEAVLDDGQRVPAALVVVGIGVLANDALAAQAGIACDDGIFVDGWCRTTAPGVFAIGDVTRQRHAVTGRFERIETWSNAQGQAQALAGILCKPDEAKAFDVVPWFWSDQGNARLQCAGAITGEQQAWYIGDAGGRVLVLWRGGCITGVAALNAARDFVQLKKLILPRNTITPEQLRAPAVNIRTLVQQALIP